MKNTDLATTLVKFDLKHPESINISAINPRPVSKLKSSFRTIKGGACTFVPARTPENYREEFSKYYFETLTAGLKIPQNYSFTGLSKTIPAGNIVKIYWKRDAFTDPKRYENMRGCEKQCHVVLSPDNADFLISTRMPMTKSQPNQKTVHFSREALYHHGASIDKFDMTMDLGPFSNIPIMSVPANFWKTMHTMVPPAIKSLQKRKLAVWVARNCHDTSWGRTEYMKRLSALMPIDFPGKCNHNIDPSKAGFGSRAQYGRNSASYGNYLFVFALHNALDNRNLGKMLHAIALEVNTTN